MKCMKKPKVYWVTGLLWFLLWTPLSIASFYKIVEDSFYVATPVLITFVMQMFIGIYMFMYALNWKIEILENEVVVVNWLRRRRKYNKSELRITLKYINSATFILWYKGKKIARISAFDDNCQELAQFKFLEKQ